jgi:hypothetical protein
MDKTARARRAAAVVFIYIYIYRPIGYDQLRYLIMPSWLTDVRILGWPHVQVQNDFSLALVFAQNAYNMVYQIAQR